MSAGEEQVDAMHIPLRALLALVALLLNGGHHTNRGPAMRSVSSRAIRIAFDFLLRLALLVALIMIARQTATR